ncbi:Fatty acid desaturase [Legionella beliardensis]|uniref:Fatty acid desaturase n=1 Tax=Legionella beliardensis TaxID=91822 RepID=A0A378IBR4_9GAMM|nr:fatty acid desaturase [Legionella beliardensis]STX29734.1 Fatty acid desaturase [Legionella beliardensis]
MNQQKTVFAKTHNNLQGIVRLTLIQLILASLIYQQNALGPLWLKLLFSVLIGFVLSGMINLAHECLHQKFAGHRWLNYSVGRVAASLLLVNFTVFKWHHLFHHQYVGTDKDTENNADFKTLSQYLVALSGLRLAKKKIASSFAVLGQQYPYYINTQKQKSEAYYDSLILLIFLLILLSLTCFYPQHMLFAYWLPLLFAYSGIMFFAIPEHNGCKPIKGYYSLARSVFTNRLVRFFMWNGNFHAEHHIHPGALPYVLKDICEKEKNYIWYREKSYLKWHYRLLKKLVIQPTVEEK